ncbi:hypothetical protein [Phaeobacter sp. J2-8]|uniref:hypothetical protein n=1 Tax=Phaeobacter sp. J2-8 TaxID=2931394 RepID=UPI001FD4C0C5|nr:hypothetical protein [Phaeobacter sp. J2-8]MCJ7872120.1 hypothetical protein [Phaeobacter sp. J2-8]
MTTDELFLSQEDLVAAGVLDWDRAVADVTESLDLLHRDQAAMVAENTLSLGRDPRAKGYGLPAWVGGRFNAAGLKWSVHRPEAPKGGAAITARTFVDDLHSGLPLGIVDAALITRVRTAALSGAIIRALMPVPRSIAIIGGGAQAISHLQMCLALFRELPAIHLWTRSGRDLFEHAQQTPPKGATVTIHASADAAARAAQVVLTCTSSPAPLLSPAAVHSDQLILQIGFHEVSFAAIDACDVVTCDLWGDFADHSAKSLFQMYRAGRFAPDQIAADAQSILSGDWRPNAGASVYFSSFGLNIFDIALAARVLRRAAAMGIGIPLGRGGHHKGTQS